MPFFDLVIHSNAKAREVNIVERSIADAVGLGIDVQNTTGVMIINFGGETTELSVLTEGGIVFNRLLKLGGTTLDQEIVNLVRNSHDFLDWKQNGRNIKISSSMFLNGDSETAFSVAGRDLITGLPMRKTISITLVRAAFKDTLLECMKAVRSMLDRTPPEIRKAIYQNGIYLTGGIANMSGLDAYVESMTKIHTTAAEKPGICAVNGLKKIMLSKDLSKLAYSMLDESYRWMR